MLTWANLESTCYFVMLMVKTGSGKSQRCLLGSPSSDGQHGDTLPQREIYIDVDT